jgi:hypothetical protein
MVEGAPFVKVRFRQEWEERKAGNGVLLEGSLPVLAVVSCHSTGFVGCMIVTSSLVLNADDLPERA